MPPAAPTLSLSRTSSTSFTASVSGGSASATHTLYYRVTGAPSSDTAGPSLLGNGAFAPVTGLSQHASYQAWAVGLEGGSYSLPSFAAVSLASPETLSGAVHSWWSSDPALASTVTGGLWTGEVPEGTPYPYAWLELPDASSHPNMVNQVEACRLVFHVWGVGAESTEYCASVVRARFDYQQVPSFGDSYCLAITPRGRRLACEGLRDQQSRLVFRSTLTYQALLQLPR